MPLVAVTDTILGAMLENVPTFSFAQPLMTLSPFLFTASAYTFVKSGSQWTGVRTHNLWAGSQTQTAQLSRLPIKTSDAVCGNTYNVMERCAEDTCC